MMDPSEIAALFRDHAEGLVLLARARFLDSHADDLVQEAFVRLARQKSTPNDPLAWLARAVRNLAIDAVRKDSRRRRRERESAASRDCWFEPPDDLVGNCLSAEEATEALLQLSESEREIVIAHLWGNMTFRQIASAFGVSSTSANRNYLKAIDKLRITLGIKNV